MSRSLVSDPSRGEVRWVWRLDGCVRGRKFERLQLPNRAGVLRFELPLGALLSCIGTGAKEKRPQRLNI